MIWLLVMLGWVFVGLLAFGLLRRAKVMVERNDVLFCVVFSPISLLIAAHLYIDSSGWWNKKI